MVVKMVSSENIVTTLAPEDILAPTVCGSVHRTVNLTHVDTRTDRVVPVMQGGRDIIVLQHVTGLWK